MVDVRKRYAEVTKAGKEKSRARPKGTPEEQRIYKIFRDRAREDYSTLKKRRNKR